MRPHSHAFLNPPAGMADLDTAAAVLLPVPYEGGVSWGKGAALGPEAVLGASAELEVYDEALRFETCRMGIATAAPPEDLSGPEAMVASVRRSMLSLLAAGKYPVVLGGDHSVSVGAFQELAARHGRLSVIQLDAHADLRESYEGDPLSHACTMARIRERTPDTLLIGVRSLCREEAERIVREEIQLCTMEAFRSGRFDLEEVIRRLPDPVYLTLDVDVLDWSVVRATGTPEPGGFFWHEALDLLGMIFRERDVVGFDVVELSQDAPDRNSAFAVAKLIYRMLGFKLASEVDRGRIRWPEQPAGPILARTGRP